MKRQTKNTRSVIAVAVAAFVLIGMLFVPAVAAENVGTHYDGTNTYKLSNISFTLNPITKTIEVYPGGTAGLAKTDEAFFAPGESVNASVFSEKNEDIVRIQVSSNVNLSEGSSLVFSNLTNTSMVLEYLGNQSRQDLFGTTGDKKIYKITTGVSNITITNGTGVEVATGASLGIDTYWAFPKQTIKVAVQPAAGFGVFGWYVNYGEEYNSSITPVLTPEAVVKISKDPLDGATTYNVTIPDSIKTTKHIGIYIEPRLRDSGSTIVSYVFLDADTYVMSIPADFSMQKQGINVTGKIVNITDCALVGNHTLNVTMQSETGYYEAGTGQAFGGLIASRNGFGMKNVVKEGSKAAYTIHLNKTYEATPVFEEVTKNNETVLDTKGMNQTVVQSHVTNGTLKSELNFRFDGVEDSSVLGKYKDKLTFFVQITPTE